MRKRVQHVKPFQQPTPTIFLSASAKGAPFSSMGWRRLLCIFIHFISLTSFTSAECTYACNSCYDPCNVCHRNNVTIICLNGQSYFNAGQLYGETLQAKLNHTLQILRRFFVEERSAHWDVMTYNADYFYQRLPSHLKTFLHGVAEGANIPIGDAKILNGMTTIVKVAGNDLVKHPGPAACAFGYIPRERTSVDSSIIIRNYDFGAPFTEIVQNLIVTIFKKMPDQKNDVAFVSMPGQVYCATCVNSQGLFLEMNNGMSSGGHKVLNVHPSMLPRMLQVAQNFDDVQSAANELATVDSDYSLLVNLANGQEGRSFEYSTHYNKHAMQSFHDKSYIATNFFTHPSWTGLIPNASDDKTWHGITRRTNLLELFAANFTSKLSLSDVQERMDVGLEDGGAKWNLTIYQVIFVPGWLKLCTRPPWHAERWTCVDLHGYMRRTESSALLIFMGVVFLVCTCFLTVVLTKERCHRVHKAGYNELP